MSKITIEVGDELFRFISFTQWVNKASSWLGSYRESNYICIDARGRICRRGEHFMLARDEDAFPVIVYSLTLNTPSSDT